MSIATRGRLINKFVAVIYRLDTVATAAVVGGGYDAEFDAVVPVDDGTQTGATSRREMSALRLNCQLDRKSWGEQNQGRGGRQVVADIVLTLHWPDLQKAGLIGTDGECTLKKGDRISGIETLKGTVEATFPNPPGMFVTGFERAGHGLAPFGTPRMNLLYVFCSYERVAAVGGL